MHLALVFVTLVPKGGEGVLLNNRWGSPGFLPPAREYGMIHSPGPGGFGEAGVSCRGDSGCVAFKDFLLGPMAALAHQGFSAFL